MSGQKYDIVIKQTEGQNGLSAEEIIGAASMLKRQKNIATLYFKAGNGDVYAVFADIFSVNAAMKKWPDSDRIVGAPEEYTLNDRWKRLVENIKEGARLRYHPDHICGCSICWCCGGKTAAGTDE